MDLAAILQAISTVGFPIVCCMYLAWSMTREHEQHRQEEIRLSEIINNNTIAITKLTDKIDSIVIKGGAEKDE